MLLPLCDVSDGAGEARTLFEDRNELNPWSFSPDGRLAFSWLEADASYHLWTVPLDLHDPDNPKPVHQRFLCTRNSVCRRRLFHRTAWWIAYKSAEPPAGIYVRRFPAASGADSAKWQVAIGGGFPSWSRSSGEGACVVESTAPHHDPPGRRHMENRCGAGRETIPGVANVREGWRRRRVRSRICLPEPLPAILRAHAGSNRHSVGKFSMPKARIQSRPRAPPNIGRHQRLVSPVSPRRSFSPRPLDTGFHPTIA